MPWLKSIATYDQEVQGNVSFVGSVNFTGSVDMPGSSAGNITANAIVVGPGGAGANVLVANGSSWLRGALYVSGNTTLTNLAASTANANAVNVGLGGVVVTGRATLANASIANTCVISTSVPTILNAVITGNVSNVTVVEASPFATPVPGVRFPGIAGEGLELTALNAFNATNQEWTMEAWVYPRAFSIVMGLGDQTNRELQVGFTAAGRPYAWFYFTVGATTFDITGSSSVALNAWHHLAVTSTVTSATTGTIRLYCDGALVATASRTTITVPTLKFIIGTSFSSHFQGDVTNFRFTAGSALYTAGTYTLPTGPFLPSPRAYLLDVSLGNVVIDNVLAGNVTCTSLSGFVANIAYGTITNLTTTNLVSTQANVATANVTNIFITGTGSRLSSRLEVTDGSTIGGNGIVWSNTSYQGALVERRSAANERYGVGVQNAFGTRVYTSGTWGGAKIGLGFSLGENSFVDALVVSRDNGNISSTISNVGINTVNPVAPLHVVGNVRVDGNLAINTLAVQGTSVTANVPLLTISSGNANVDSITRYPSVTSTTNTTGYSAAPLLYTTAGDFNTAANIASTGIITLTKNLAAQQNVVEYALPALGPGIAFNLAFNYQYTGSADGFCMQFLHTSTDTMSTSHVRPLTAVAAGYRLAYSIFEPASYGVSFYANDATGSSTVLSQKQGVLPATTWFNWNLGFDGASTFNLRVAYASNNTTYHSATVTDTAFTTRFAAAAYKNTIRFIGATGGQSATQLLANVALSCDSGHGDIVYGNTGVLRYSSRLKANALTVAQNGFVGINTPTPLEGLHATGNVRVDGNLAVTDISSSGAVSNVNGLAVTANKIINWQGGTIQPCMLSLWPYNTSSAATNYFGFGLQSGVLRYHVSQLEFKHSFYGAGSVFANITSVGLELAANSVATARTGVLFSNSSYTGALVERRNAASSTDRYGISVDASTIRTHASGSLATAKVVLGFAGASETTFTDGLVVTRGPNGATSTTSNVGINTSSPTEALHVIGNAYVNGAITASGDVTAFSDRNLKSNLQVITHSLDKLKSLTGYTFERIDMPPSSGRFAGLIAQDVMQVLPEAVQSHQNNTLAIAYGPLTALLVEAIKDLGAQVEAIKDLGAQVEAIKDLEARVGRLEN